MTAYFYHCFAFNYIVLKAIVKRIHVLSVTMTCCPTISVNSSLFQTSEIL